jgi:hypothetical protein
MLLLLLLLPPMTTPLLLLPLLNCINPPELGITIRRAPINKFLLPISPILNIKEKNCQLLFEKMYEISHHQKNDVEITIGEEKKGQDVWGVTPSLMSVGGPHHYRLVSRDSFDRFWNTVKCRFDKRTNSFDEI